MQPTLFIVTHKKQSNTRCWVQCTTFQVKARNKRVLIQTLNSHLRSHRNFDRRCIIVRVRVGSSWVTVVIPVPLSLTQQRSSYVKSNNDHPIGLVHYCKHGCFMQQQSLLQLDDPEERV